jgi:hypothetical protein
MSNSTIVMVSSAASFNLDNSMFVVDGSLLEGYAFDKNIFFMLGLKEDKDYCFVGATNYVKHPYRFRIGGDSVDSLYEAFLYDESRISEVLDFMYKSILSHWFREDIKQFDKYKNEIKPSDLLPDFNTEWGFYTLDSVLEQFIIEFPEFKSINV